MLTELTTTHEGFVTKRRHFWYFFIGINNGSDWIEVERSKLTDNDFQLNDFRNFYNKSKKANEIKNIENKVLFAMIYYL